MKIGGKFIEFLVILFLLTSCHYEYNSVSDENRGVMRNDMKNTLMELENINENLSDLQYDNLDMSRLITTPPPPPIGNGELISFSITEDVSLKDVFIELGRLAEIDIQIDPKINTGIILKITEKPVNVVIEKICELANLRYEYTDGILKIERDLPYTVNYDVDILVEHDLWSTIETSITYLLEIFPVKTQKNLSITASESENSLNFSAEEENIEQKFSIDKAGGIISVHANSRAQKAIDNYIKQAKKNYSAQVLIEAKVVDVTLNENYQAGIDWSLSPNGSSNSSDDTTSTDEIVNNITKNSLSISVGGAVNTLNFLRKIGSKNLSVIVSALQEFGDTKTISSPRISTLNNQTATLDFIDTLVYFSVEKEEDGEDKDGQTKYSYTSTKEEEEVGVKLEITPTINVEKQEITLTVKPEISSPGDYVTDPANPENRVPQINKRTLETSLKIKSGDVMVIGGLMSETVSNAENGVPFLMNIPILGYFFKHTSKKKDLTETVIFIKATIVNPGDSMSKKERNILNNFRKEN